MEELNRSIISLMELTKNPTIIETFVDILLCAVPIWVAIMIGLIIGWSWRPRWSGLLCLGLRSKLRFLWAAFPPGFGARRLWFAITALSAFSVFRTLCNSALKRGKKDSGRSSVDGDSGCSGSDLGLEISDTTRSASNGEHDTISVTENDLEHLLHLLEGKDGEISWQSMMGRTTSNMTYQAWRYEPENGPTVYCSRTVFEDSNCEMVRDFFWDDEFRPEWDPMLTYCKILEECPNTGTMIVHWIKKFPFFCSDREYIIGRRIWEAGKAYYCVTKAVPYGSLPKHDKPRRVEHYFSSWVIKPAESLKGDGHMTACEVTLIHYEDMGIPKDIAKLGVRHGMWGTVKKLHAGMRAYQNAWKSEASLSKSALMAKMTTKIQSDGNPFLGGSPGGEDKSQSLDSYMLRKHGIDWKWVVVGGTVAVICGLRAGIIGKALMIGAGRRILKW